MLSELRSSTLQYAYSKELETVITELISDPKKLENLKTEAIDNASKFSLDTFQCYFENNVLNWLQEN